MKLEPNSLDWNELEHELELEDLKHTIDTSQPKSCYCTQMSNNALQIFPLIVWSWAPLLSFFYCLLFQYIPAECTKSNSFLYCHLFVWNVKWCAQVQFFNTLIKGSIVVLLRLAHCLKYSFLQFSCFLSKLSWLPTRI